MGTAGRDGIALYRVRRDRPGGRLGPPQVLAMTPRFDRHCEECGYDGEFEDVHNPGSDVIPVSKCAECGNVTATKCGCDNPEVHR